MSYRVIELLLPALFALESFLSAVYVAGLIAALPGHDAAAVSLVLLRGGVGAMQFVAAWMLGTKRPPGVALARWALMGSALWTLLGIGFNLAPTNVYPWWRWRVTGAYGLYALAMLGALRVLSRSRDMKGVKNMKDVKDLRGTDKT